MKSFSSFLTVLSFLFLLSLSTLTKAQPPAETTDVANAEESSAKNSSEEFSSEQVKSRIAEDLNFLASDEREGRGPYTLGQQAAAEYIADQFAAAGLKTNLIRNEPYQIFSTRKFYDLGEKNELTFTIAGKAIDGMSVSDYRPLSPSTSGKFDLPLAMVGYGISSEKDEYDDYANFDANGKAVVILRHEPDQSGKTGKFAGPGNSTSAYLSTKIQNAVDHGAQAVLIVSDEVAVERAKGEDNLLDFQIRMPKEFEPQLPVFHVKRTLIDQLLKEAGKPSLAEWEATVDVNLKSSSFDFPGIRAKGEVEIAASERVEKNVLGVLPGKGNLASEVVVVGAHYDHIGRGGAGSLAPWTRDIHNGADDNASGTTALLETARQCAAWDIANRRTILFIAFAAEEQGLLGSEYYVRHPLFALEKTVAMLNFDMVGRLRNENLTVYGYNTAEQFEAWLDQAAPKFGIEIDKVKGGRGPSDHASFYGRGIPVMHDFTGFHSQYHRPSDDIEHINVAGIGRVVGMNMLLLQHLATEPITPVPNAEESLLEKIFGGGPDGPNSPQKRRTLGVALGDYDEIGMPITGIVVGSIAENSGIKQGDTLVSWADKPMKTIRDLRQAIEAVEPGKKIPLKLLRGEEELTIEVEFPK